METGGKEKGRREGERRKVTASINFTCGILCSQKFYYIIINNFYFFTFAKFFDFFCAKSLHFFCQIFAFLISRKFCIYPWNRLQQNFAKKTQEAKIQDGIYKKIKERQESD